MKPFPRSLKSPLFLPLLFSVAAYGASLWFSLLRDRNQAAEVGQLAQAHLDYALQLKDDMAIIDWAKNFEKSTHVSAYRVTLQSKILVQGGNQNFIPAETTPGLSYQFPSDWIFRRDGPMESPDSTEFVLIYHLSPGPWLVGFIVFAGCFFLTYTTARLAPRTFHTLSSELPIFHSEGVPLSSPVTTPPSPPLPAGVEGKSFLFLDRTYVIQRASPEAAQLLEMNPARLHNRHFLDLSPEPDLMRAIEEGEEVRIPKPFSSHPGLSVTLRPDPNGTLLFLETSPTPKALEKL